VLGFPFDSTFDPSTKEIEENVAEKLLILRKMYYLSPLGEDRIHLENENKSQFILHFSRFSLSLQSSTGESL